MGERCPELLGREPGEWDVLSGDAMGRNGQLQRILRTLLAPK
jgi:hypothetical protein